MTEMIERVARTLAECAMEPFDDISWSKYMGDARAAIEAMREPTDKMLRMGVGYTDFILPDGFDKTPEAYLDEMKCAWTEMIDAALSPAPPVEAKSEET